MLMQEMRNDMPQHLVLCADTPLSKPLFLSCLWQGSTLTRFTQTKQYCNFVKTGLMTSQL